MGSLNLRWRWFRGRIVPLAGSLLALLLASCGGGSSSSGIGPAPSPSFSIGVSPQNQSIGAGQSATLNLSVNAMNGFNQGIEVSVTGLPRGVRSEEHTSELQSLTNLVCRLLLAKKNE